MVVLESMPNLPGDLGKYLRVPDLTLLWADGGPCLWLSLGPLHRGIRSTAHGTANVRKPEQPLVSLASFNCRLRSMG